MIETFDHGGNIFTIARSLGVSPEDIVDFSASINPLGLAKGVRKAVCAAFDRVMHYPDSGSPDLRKALARFHGVDVKRVIVANGSTELIYLIPRLIKGSRGLVIAPAFSEYAKALSHAGMEVHYLILNAENSFEFPLEEFEQRLSEGYDVVFLCNPGNPSGALIPLPVIGGILDLCRAAGTFLVLDEAFMDFCEGGSGKYLVTDRGEGIVLRSMTKFFAVPGLRIGYAIASPEIVRRLESVRGPWSVNTPAQIAGVVSLGDPGYIRRTIRYVEAERAFLASELASIGGLRPFPSAANYLLVRTGGSYAAAELREELIKKLILIRDCSNFHGLDGGFFRVAVRKREENVRLLEALREIFGGN
jgi:threonine-phosphate decarboxylase